MLWKINPILRGWAAYFRYGASKKDVLLPGLVRLVANDLLDPPQAPPPDLETAPARRYYGADRICEDSLVLYNPAKMRVERYRFRGTQIATPYNVDEVDPAGGRFRRTGHDDGRFVGRVTELVS